MLLQCTWGSQYEDSNGQNATMNPMIDYYTGQNDAKYKKGAKMSSGMQKKQQKRQEKAANRAD